MPILTPVPPFSGKVEGEPDLRDRQFQLGDFLVGNDTEYPFIEVDGIDLPPMRSADSPIPRRHGAYSGVDYLNGRTITLAVGVVDDYESEQFQNKLDAIKGAFAPRTTETWLRFRHNGPTRRIRARPRKLQYKGDADFAWGIPKVVTQIYCPDPIMYDDTITSGSINTGPEDLGGFGFPMSFPLGFGAIASSALLEVVNKGNFDATPVFTITGPMTYPSITSATQDKHLAFNIDLLAGELLVIDCAARTVTLAGASRYGSLTSDSRWFTLSPGVNQIQLGSIVGVGLLTVEFRHAYI